jgi:hypothetical protein
MNDAVTVDTLHALKAQEERDAVAVLGLGMAVIQQQMVILALLDQANEPGQGPVIRRR